MLEKAVRTGAESPELHAMSHRRIWAAFIVTLASCLSVWWILDRRVEERQLLDPGAFASDRFNRWEFPATPPPGVSFDRDIASSVYLFASSADTADFIWFTPFQPKQVPVKFATKPWGGGWLIGINLGGWEEAPGEMAARWAPRTPGRNFLFRLPNGEIESLHQLDDEQAMAMSTSWIANSTAPIAPLSAFWVQWYLNLTKVSDSPWREVRVGASSGGLKGTQYDSLMPLSDGSWITAVASDGRSIAAVEMSDSAGAIALNGQWREGVMLVSSDTAPIDWSTLGWPDSAAVLGGAPVIDADFGSWEQGFEKWGVYAGDQRVVWRTQTKKSPSNFSANSSVAESVSVDPAVQPRGSTSTGLDFKIDRDRNLGVLRNHRTNAEMDLVWEPREVVAQDSEGKRIWSLELNTDDRPKVWEVDLYRNRKYQAVVFAEKEVHVIDVLGRSVRGFPKRWSRGFSAVGVLDYDRNRQYRFLMAAPNGELFNFRREGERTPGWNFKPQSERYITSIAHVRVGNKDYIFAGQDDNSVRFLKRSGEDRFSAPLKFPSGQEPVFRLGATIETSAVLFFDGAGVIQERIIGSNQPTGMNGLTRGLSVEVEDRTGDGIPEVVVQTSTGEEIWGANNERINL